MLAPIFYIPHGGGPMPLMGDANHASLISFLRSLPQKFAVPKAVVLISAHWEAAQPTVYSGAAHGMLFDYHGFPPETYRFSYPAAGAPAVAERIVELLAAAGIAATRDTQRGFDHGTFVPMLLVDPKVQMPCLQLSLLKGLDPAAHINLGLALQALRDEDVVIIGSGMSFHNLQAVWAGEQKELRTASDRFHQWLLQTVAQEPLTAAQRLDQLAKWQQAPYARFAHPRAEHLLPLHVCAGIAGGAQARVLYDDVLMHHKVAAFGWAA